LKTGSKAIRPLVIIQLMFNIGGGNLLLRFGRHVLTCVGSPSLADAAILGRFSDI